jgi:hypothetical protein
LQKQLLNTLAVSLTAGTTYGMLITNAYTPNFDTDAFRSAIGANEPAASGTYVTGGLALPATLATTVAAPAARNMKFASGNPSYTTATLTARGLGIYVHRGGASTADEMISDSDFGADVSSTAGTYTVTCPANGWFYFSY